MANFLLIRELCELKKITIRELASRIGKKIVAYRLLSGMEQRIQKPLRQ